MSPSRSEMELLEQIAGLPREIQPANDPWDRIAARLGFAASDGPERAPVSRWRRVRALQAVAAVAVLGTAVLMFPGPRPEQPAPLTGRSAYHQPGISLELAVSEAEYQAAFREFIPVGDAKQELSALTVETIETGWSDLRKVELALSEALARDPSDPFLNERMFELRARQLGFLRQLAALDRNNRRLTI